MYTITQPISLYYNVQKHILAQAKLIDGNTHQSFHYLNSMDSSLLRIHTLTALLQETLTGLLRAIFDAPERQFSIQLILCTLRFSDFIRLIGSGSSRFELVFDGRLANAEIFRHQFALDSFHVISELRRILNSWSLSVTGFDRSFFTPARLFRNGMVQSISSAVTVAAATVRFVLTFYGRFDQASLSLMTVDRLEMFFIVIE